MGKPIGLGALYSTTFIANEVREKCEAQYGGMSQFSDPAGRRKAPAPGARGDRLDQPGRSENDDGVRQPLSTEQGLGLQIIELKTRSARVRRVQEVDIRIRFPIGRARDQRSDAIRGGRVVANGGEIEYLTVSPDFPQLAVELGGRQFFSPDILNL